MKIRSGFVSNSSSTSYTCELCGHTESGWDSSGIEEFGFARCPSEHVICADETLPISKDSRAQMLAEMCANADWLEEMKLDDENFDPTTLDDDLIEEIYAEFQSNFGDGETISCAQCPICSFDTITDQDFKCYLKKVYQVPESEVLAFIKGGNKRRKRIYDGEYISYTLQKFSNQRLDLEKDIREHFSDYATFNKYLRGKDED